MYSSVEAVVKGISLPGAVVKGISLSGAVVKGISLTGAVVKCENLKTLKKKFIFTNGRTGKI